MSEKRVCLGKIVGVHGIRGEVKVKSYTAVDKDIAAYGELEDKAAGKRFSLKVTGHSKDLLRIKIKGIDDRTMAETLVGTEFYAPRGVLPELKTEEVYYEADLVGMKFLSFSSLPKSYPIFTEYWNPDATEIILLIVSSPVTVY